MPEMLIATSLVVVGIVAVAELAMRELLEDAVAAIRS
jgi:hypothetical protein